MNKKTLNPENLLSRLSKEAIFRAFINTPFTLEKPISSPLREDNNPSFVVFEGKRGLMYYDFATGERGDCFQLVKELYKCNFDEALKIIATRFGIDQEFNFVPLRNNLEKTNVPLQVSTKTEKIVRDLFYKPLYGDLDLLLKEDLDYYAQYSIPEKILKDYKVRRIEKVLRKVERNGILVDESYDFSKTPAYAYQALGLNKNRLLVTSGFKVHKPFDTTRFMSFCDSTTLFYNPYLFNKSDELNEDYLFITKSMKDSMCLTALGFHSLAIQGESVKPESVEDIINKCIGEFLELENLNKDFKLVLLFDNDTAGIKCSNRFLEFYEENYRTKIVQLFVHVDYGKDVSDFVKSTNLNYVKNKLLDMIT